MDSVCVAEGTAAQASAGVQPVLFRVPPLLAPEATTPFSIGAGSLLRAVSSLGAVECFRRCLCEAEQVCLTPDPEALVRVWPVPGLRFLLWMQ